MNLTKKKTKYLRRVKRKQTRKNQRGGANKRVDKEIADLRNNGYEVVKSVNDLGELTVSKEGQIYKIIFPPKYPFEAPTITCNGQVISALPWSPARLIKKILESQNSQNSQKVLILCHPQIVTGSFSPLTLKDHWYGHEKNNFFSKVFKDYDLKGDVKFETVDTLPGGNYTADAFSDEFINKHINDYDVLVVPDCGGPWYELQMISQYQMTSSTFKKVKDYTKEEINTNIKLLIDLSLKLTKVVKPNGIINFSKFLHAGEIIIEGNRFLDFKDALLFYLNKNGFDAVFNGFGIIGIKKNYTSLIIDLAQDSYNINNKRQSLSEKDRKELIEKIRN